MNAQSIFKNVGKQMEEIVDSLVVARELTDQEIDAIAGAGPMTADVL